MDEIKTLLETQNQLLRELLALVKAQATRIDGHDAQLKAHFGTLEAQAAAVGALDAALGRLTSLLTDGRFGSPPPVN